MDRKYTIGDELPKQADLIPERVNATLTPNGRSAP